MPFFATVQSRLPKKRWKRVLLYAASTFLIVLAADMSLTAYWRRIAISCETTFITAPLNPDGTPDYLTWLNRRAAQGVTPDNNAAIPILRATGLEPSSDADSAWQTVIVTDLGIPGEKLPQKLVRYTAWAAAQGIGGAKPTPFTEPSDAEAWQKLSDQEDHMCERLWSDDEIPDGARWLDSQKEVLALAHQAASLSHYYVPLIASGRRPGPGEIALARLPFMANFRYLGRMLDADALRHARAADKVVFIRDVTDALRLGSLLSRGVTIIEQLLGLVILRESLDVILTALDQMSPADVRTLLASVNEAPPAPELDFTIERCLILDMCCFEATAGLGHSPLGPSFQPKAAPILSLVVPVHFNRMMADTNALFDQIAEAQRIPSFKTRTEALAAIQRQLNSGTRNWMLDFAGLRQVNPAHEPWISQDVLAQEILTRRDLTRLALALAIYHADKGTYPPTLDALAGTRGILPSIPRDGFTGQPLIYRLDNRGYILYSVGKDLHDDNADPDKDLVVRTDH